MPRVVMPGSRLTADGSRAPRPNRHWTDEELLTRCLTYWEQWNGRRERFESWRRSLLGGLVVAGLVVGLLLL